MALQRSFLVYLVIIISELRGKLVLAQATETPSQAWLDSFQDSSLWILIVGFISAFVLAFGIGANDVANAFGTAVGAKVLTLRQLAMVEPFATDVVWIVVAGFIVAFLLAFGIGANDVANSFGTSVGAKVLTLRQACMLASVFELAGAILIGYKVSDTIRKGIVDITIYNGHEKELMLGSLAALTGSAIWLLAATFFKLPISGTHSIVGATLGFTLVARGGEGIQWGTIGQIVGSWFVSPVLSGLISAILFIFIRHFILRKAKPLEPGLRALPIFYFFTLFVNVFSVVHDGPALLKFDQIPVWGAIILAVGLSLIAGLVVQFYIVPRQRSAILADQAKRKQMDPVNFKLGGSTANTTPADSRTISLEDLPGVGKTEDAVHNTTLKVPTTYCFPTHCEIIEDVAHNGSIANGKSLHTDGDKETSLTMNGSVVKENDTEKVMPQTNLGVLGVPNSPTSESLVLPHNSSQVPLVPNGKSKEVFIPMTDGEKDNSDEMDVNKDKPETAKLFSFLQILTASFGSFAHGGNDVSNAIGPLIALWLIYYRGTVEQKDETPWYILVYGGIGISIGLWVWGRRVIKTLGEDLTKLTPSSGFTIEIGAAFTVLTASKIGIPISTTHCKVGSIVFVGWVRSRQGVDWHLFRNIIFAWIITLPVAGGLSALIMFILRSAAL